MAITRTRHSSERISNAFQSRANSSHGLAPISRPVAVASQETFTLGVVDRFIDSLDLCPWPTLAGRGFGLDAEKPARPIYTADERRRRDASHWTLVQGLLAPVQFLVFLVSLGLVLNCLATGAGAHAATVSVVVKTITLYAIMITGSIWEREVFGRYLFAPSFFWEDAVSMLVLALHTAYLAVLATGALDVHGQLVLALAAYASYVVNAGQFLLKLRSARLERGDALEWPAGSGLVR